MKRTRIYFYILLMIFILLVMRQIVSLISPSITVLNKTDEPIYIRPIQHIAKGEELTEEERAEWEAVLLIPPGNKRDFPISLSSLFSSKQMFFSPDWGIGNISPYVSVGLHNFDINRNERTCRINLKIYDDYYEIIPEERFYCYKKLLSLNGRMTIRAEGITKYIDYYGTNTDKIKKRIVYVYQ